MTHNCKACEREKRAKKRTDINVAWYNADGRFFCGEHREEAYALCRQAADSHSIKWSTGFGIGLL
jgi:hypothetical protein